MGHSLKSWTQRSSWVNSEYSGILLLGPRKKKKRSKKRLQTGQVASIILYILHGPCVFLNTSYFRTEGRKRTRTGNTPKGKGSPACHNTLNAYTPWISHQSTLQLIHWQTNLSLGIITDLPQTLFSSIQAEKGLEHLNSSFLEEELRTWPCRSASVRIPSKCSDSRLGLQQAGVGMRNQWLFPLEKCEKRRRGSHPTHRPGAALLAFTGKACREKGRKWKENECINSCKAHQWMQFQGVKMELPVDLQCRGIQAAFLAFTASQKVSARQIKCQRDK